MDNFTQLDELTAHFFKMHWSSNLEHPKWNYDWNWTGAVPNYRLGGLYAIFANDRLLYIGLGNSRGGGRYSEHGISRRLLSHVLKLAPDEGRQGYLPQERWAKVNMTRLATIGFPSDLNYLAPALEDFLIGELNPPENSVKRKNA